MTDRVQEQAGGAAALIAGRAPIGWGADLLKAAMIEAMLNITIAVMRTLWRPGPSARFSATGGGRKKAGVQTSGSAECDRRSRRGRG
ncbi:hypothetical protein [Thermomonospora umbrina]|uniref:hypothetical protein n=1 Tax=Thermomonospora umbrina TaxID=111806 RepID=UPI000E254B80|nr:hypothetical protein [Thermomonospora umbrina]